MQVTVNTVDTVDTVDTCLTVMHTLLRSDPL